MKQTDVHVHAPGFEPEIDKVLRQSRSQRPAPRSVTADRKHVGSGDDIELLRLPGKSPHIPKFEFRKVKVDEERRERARELV